MWAARNAFLTAGLAGPEGDLYWDYTSLLLTAGDGTGATNSTFLDSGPNNLTVTRNGDATQGLVSPVSGGGSAYFDGSGDYLQVTTADALSFGSGDYTVEAWIRPQSTGSSQAIIAGSSGRFALRLGAGYQQSMNGLQITAAQSADYASASHSFAENVWAHVAVTRSGGTVRFFVNGVQKTTSGSDTQSWGNQNYVRVAQSNGDEQFKGSISNLRVVKGTAVYTGNFTPPTEPLTAITGTSLLLNMNNASIVDRTGKNTLSVFGNAQASAVETKFGARSIYFDGNGDVITAPSAPEFQLDTGDFTVEFWWNGSASGSYTQNVGTMNTGTEQGTWRIGTRFNSANEIYFARGAGSGFNEVRYASNVNNGSWHHIACVRSSGVISMFVDGTKLTPLAGSESISGTCTSSNLFRAGYNPRDNTYITGYMEDVRVTKGVARYTANFTPPTEKFPVGPHRFPMPKLSNVSSTGAINSSNSSTFSVPVTDSSQNFAVVSIALGFNRNIGNGSDMASASDFSVTWGGSPMTFLGYAFRTAVYYLQGPDVFNGSSSQKTVQITANAAIDGFSAQAAVFSDVGTFNGDYLSTNQFSSPHLIDMTPSVSDLNGLAIICVAETYASPLNSYSGAEIAKWGPTSGNFSAGIFYKPVANTSQFRVIANTNTNWGGVVGFFVPRKL